MFEDVDLEAAAMELEQASTHFEMFKTLAECRLLDGGDSEQTVYDRGSGGFLAINGAVTCAGFEDLEVCVVTEADWQREALAEAIQVYWPWATADRLVWPEDLDIREVAIASN